MPYCAGYFRLNLGHSGVKMSQFYTVLPIIVLMSTVTFPIGMKYSGIYGPKTFMLLGGLVLITSVIVASYMTEPLLFYLIFAVGFGMGKGLAYPSSFKAGWILLPGRKGFVNGIVQSGIGFGAFLYGTIASFLVNPHNVKNHPVEVSENIVENYFPLEINARVPFMFQCLGIIWACCIIVSLVTVRVSRKEAKQHLDKSM